ncbi:MAG: hypothetical protein RIB45_06065 [Marivibrio sp.]|uniref:hypothetical protein n=1 Tax=Marivibrio sp. TaxID=2039719 RepID=UPI0032F025F9
MAAKPNIDEEAAATMRASAWQKGVLTSQQSAAAAPVPEDPANEQNRRNEDLREQADVENAFRLAEVGGFLAGRIERTGASGNELKGIGGKDGKKNARREGNGLYLSALLSQIDDLNDQIAFHDSEIERLNEELNEIDELLEKIENGTLDPDDPGDAALMKKYGITEQDIENGDAGQKLRTARDDREKQIDWHEGQRAKAETERDEKLQNLNDDVNRRVEKGETIDPQDSSHPLVRKMLEAIESSSEITYHDTQLLRLKDLEQFEGDPDYIDKIDAFLRDADEATLADMRQDETLDPTIAERVAVHQFGEMYDRIQSLKGTDNYDRALHGILGRIDSQTRNALVNDEEAPEDVIAAIYETLDEEPKNDSSDERPEEVERSQVASANPAITPQI